MAQAQERPRITEIQVRIDCNGCVQKIKKALQGIKGISDVYIDLPRQKLTIIGSADPEKIIKAIKKARKTATIYSHSEVQEPPPTQPTDPTPPDNEEPPPAEQPEPPPTEQPPKEQPPPPPPENPTTQPPPENPNTNEPPHPPVDPNEAQRRHPHNEVVEEVHVIHHHTPDYPNRPGYYNPEPPRHSQGPRDYSHGYDRDYSPEQARYNQSYGPGYNHGPPGYNNPSYSSRLTGYSQGYEPGYNPGPPGHARSHGYGGDWSGRPEPSYRPERPQPVHVTHSYNQYRPPPNVTQYEYVGPPPNATQNEYFRPTPNATQYEYVQSPPRSTPYARTESDYYYYNNGDYQNNNNGYVSSIFSEENPNACTIS